MGLYLREDFKLAWRGKDPYQLLNNMDGEIFRDLEARRTYRFEFKGKGFFAKVHRGVGWKDIAGNLIRFRMPVLGAYNEWQALKKLKQLNIDTMTPVAFGKKGYNPARQKSFLVTEELGNMSSLEDICDNWKQSPPPYCIKKAIVEKLADISRILHDNGINHRDYYFCHFLLPAGSLNNYLSDKKADKILRFYIIDLHRAQIRATLPNRWRIKDLSGLLFSSMNYGFTQRDMFRFIRIYTGLPLKYALIKYRTMWNRINIKSETLYQRMQRKSGHPNY